MKKKKEKNTWIIRKAVLADTIEEAIKKEKKSKILDIVMASAGGPQLNPVIGFAPNGTNEED